VDCAGAQTLEHTAEHVLHQIVDDRIARPAMPAHQHAHAVLVLAHELRLGLPIALGNPRDQAVSCANRRRHRSVTGRHPFPPELIAYKRIENLQV